MTIFDGVPMKPMLSPTMQTVLSVVTLIADSLLEAGKVREERRAGEGERPAGGPLDGVMAQAGLELPGLAQMLEQLMGGGEDAKKAATLITQNPDPAGLLQQFVEHFGRVEAANAGPVAAPAAWTAPAAPPTRAGSAPPAFRPEFTREGRAAARASVPMGTRPVHASAEAPRVIDKLNGISVEPAVGRSSLVIMVEHQLGLLRHRMQAHEAALEERLTRAEAKLANLRKELDELAAMRTRAAAAAWSEAEQRVESRFSADVVSNDMAVATEIECAAPKDSQNDTAGIQLLPAASDAEALQAVQLIASFGDDIEVQQGRQLARVAAVEEEAEVMRALVQREREALGLMVHHG